MQNVIGTRIKQLRLANCMTQKEVASKLHISNTTLSQYENGSRVPSDDIKLKIARLFGVTTDYLLDERVTTPVAAPANFDDIELYLTNLYRKAKFELAPGTEGELVELIESFTELSPDNRAKLLELSRLYLGAQGNSAENK